ncbi:MAG: pilin [Gammaproteobacteria bacterium]
MNNIYKGVSPIEILVFIAIVTFLVAIAIPLYDHYVMRTKMNKVFDVIVEHSTAVGEYFVREGVMPLTASDAGLDTSANQSEHLKLIIYANISPTQVNMSYTLDNFSEEVDDATIVYKGAAAADGVNWACESSEVSNEYLPDRCQGRS